MRNKGYLIGAPKATSWVEVWYDTPEGGDREFYVSASTKHLHLEFCMDRDRAFELVRLLSTLLDEPEE